MIPGALIGFKGALIFSAPADTLYVPLGRQRPCAMNSGDRCGD